MNYSFKKYIFYKFYVILMNYFIYFLYKKFEKIKRYKLFKNIELFYDIIKQNDTFRKHFEYLPKNLFYLLVKRIKRGFVLHALIINCYTN